MAAFNSFHAPCQWPKLNLHCTILTRITRIKALDLVEDQYPELVTNPVSSINIQTLKKISVVATNAHR
jgi:hypothetical protein